MVCKGRCENMKRIFEILLSLLAGLAMAGCATTAPARKLSVMVPAGSPALAQVFVQEDADSYSVDLVNGSDPLVAAFGSGSHDVIFAPTNLGAKLYSSGCGYVFAGTVVWGNYYLVAKTEEDFTLASLTGRTVVVFGQNQTSDIILRYILAENGVEAELTYVDAVATATAEFIADESLIILTAEPSLSTLLGRVDGIQIIDLQEAYSDITGSDSYPQAGVFLKADLEPELADAFLSDLDSSVRRVCDNVEEASDLAVSLGYGFTREVLLSAIPNSHLSFVSAQSSRTALETYFSMILEYNPALIGNALPDSGFYYSSPGEEG